MLAARNEAPHARQFGLRWAAWSAWLWPASLTLAALLLRLVPFFAAYPLHRDEALYGYWARLIASGQDPLLLTSWVDKPPLTLYLIASSLRLFGAGDVARGDFSLRVPGMLASVLTVPALYGFAARLYGRRVALLAAGLLALSPFAILFAPTAFTDPWLTLWLILAAWAALARRPFVAGLLTGLAVASKQQGVFVVPLVLMLLGGGRRTNDEGRTTDDGRRHPERVGGSTQLAGERQSKDERVGGSTQLAGERQSKDGRVGGSTQLTESHQSKDERPVVRRPSSFVVRLSSLLGFALVFGPLTYWDSLRWHNRPSFWDRSLSTYNPLTIAPPAEWPARLGHWAEQAGYWFGQPVITAGVVALAAGAVVFVLTRNRGFSRSGFLSAMGVSPAEASIPVASEKMTLLIAAYAIGYFAVHVIVTFQPWDRYLLPLLPLVCLLAAQGLAVLLARGRGGYLPLACAAILCYAASLGVLGRLPVGSDHGAYTGLSDVVAEVRSLPADAVIYQHSLGWHFDYTLFDAPQERRWFGSGWQLADAASRVAAQGRDQWVVLPEFELEWAEAARLPLAARGLALRETKRVHRPDGSTSFVMYEVVGATPSGVAKPRRSPGGAP